MKGVMAMLNLPLVTSMVFCEQAIVEEQTRKVSLIHCFTVRYFNKFPTPPHGMMVLVQFADGMGQGHLELVLTDLKKDRALARRTARLLLTSSLQPGRFLCRFDELVLPRSGRFEFLLTIDGQMVAQHTFHAVKAE
jgi:hypothetical protein